MGVRVSFHRAIADVKKTVHGPEQLQLIHAVQAEGEKLIAARTNERIIRKLVRALHAAADLLEELQDGGAENPELRTIYAALADYYGGKQE